MESEWGVWWESGPDWKRCQTGFPVGLCYGQGMYNLGSNSAGFFYAALPRALTPSSASPQLGTSFPFPTHSCAPWCGSGHGDDFLHFSPGAWTKNHYASCPFLWGSIATGTFHTLYSDQPRPPGL